VDEGKDSSDVETLKGASVDSKIDDTTQPKTSHSPHFPLTLFNPAPECGHQPTLGLSTLFRSRTGLTRLGQDSQQKQHRLSGSFLACLDVIVRHPEILYCEYLSCYLNAGAKHRVLLGQPLITSRFNRTAPFSLTSRRASML
jgi:hypothetical protein